MLQTYKAILRGNYLEWIGEIPEQVEEHPVDVHVTILSDESILPGVSRGAGMAEALERLASINALSSITDPMSWQREGRQDRQLPDRD